MPIPKEEFETRIKRIQKILQEREIDGVFLWGDEFYTGYVRYVSDYAPLLEYAAVLIPADSEPILMAGPECEDLARNTSKIKNVQIISDLAIPGEEYPHSKMVTIEKIVKEVYSDKKPKKIGIVDMNGIPFFLYRALQKAFGKDVELVDFTEPLDEMRAIKSENEIAAIRKAYEIASKGLEIGIEAVKPGKRECDIAAEITEFMWSEGPEQISHLFMIASGERLAGMMVLSRPTNKIIRDGELVVIDVGVVVDGYYSDHARTIIAGSQKPEKLVRLIEIAKKAQKETIKAMRPGVKGYEVDRVARSIVEREGFGKNLIAGPVHGVGLAHCEKPMCGPTSQVVLQKGMTFAVDLGLWNLPYGGVRIESGVLITEDGAEVLTKIKEEE